MVSQHPPPRQSVAREELECATCLIELQQDVHTGKHASSLIAAQYVAEQITANCVAQTWQPMLDILHSWPLPSLVVI